MSQDSYSEQSCVILGGGGHAKVVIDSLLAAHRVEPVAVLDQDRSRWGGEVLGVPVVGDDSRLPELVEAGLRYFAVGVGWTGTTDQRRRLFQLGTSSGLEAVSVIHPSVISSSWVQIGTGAQLLPGSIINAGSVLGRNVVVNTGAVVEHDCKVGDDVFIATGARLASTIRIEQGAFIGAGAVIKQCITISEGAIVGAGAVVVDNVAPFTVVVGVPAKPIGAPYA